MFTPKQQILSSWCVRTFSRLQKGSGTEKKASAQSLLAWSKKKYGGSGSSFVGSVTRGRFGGLDPLSTHFPLFFSPNKNFFFFSFLYGIPLGRRKRNLVQPFWGGGTLFGGRSGWAGKIGIWLSSASLLLPWTGRLFSRMFQTHNFAFPSYNRKTQPASWKKKGKIHSVKFWSSCFVFQGSLLQKTGVEGKNVRWMTYKITFLEEEEEEHTATPFMAHNKKRNKQQKAEKRKEKEMGWLCFLIFLPPHRLNPPFPDTFGWWKALINNPSLYAARNVAVKVCGMG